MNRSLLVVALLGIIALPSAVAQPLEGTKVTDRLWDEGDGIRVSERLEFRVANASSFTKQPWVNFSADMERMEGNPIVSASLGNQTHVLETERKDSSGPQTPGFQDFQANLSGLFPDARDGDALVLTVNYTTRGPSHSGRFGYAFDQAIVYVTPAKGHDVRVERINGFMPTGNGDEQHAVVGAVPEGYSYRVEFAEPGDLRDLNTYVYGGIGIVLGFLIAWFLLKRQPKAKKFEKGGQMESSVMLEARRRTLMAALKELELAHEAKEIPDTAYAPLKEEYKAQTVRVLRSIEDKKETPDKP
jgi:hypothetical protein